VRQLDATATGQQLINSMNDDNVDDDERQRNKNHDVSGYTISLFFSQYALN
jgi:hypothetical protein